MSTFAPNAELIMVDADRGEMSKFDGYGIEVEGRIECLLEEFIDIALDLTKDFIMPNFEPWLTKIYQWKEELPSDIPAIPNDEEGFVDAYDFVDKLSEVLSDEEIIMVDTGGNLTWTCNNLKVKSNQRVISAWNFTPMGYALPASIGAAAAEKDKSITCIIGDGGLQLCLGELATIVRYKIPVKIILFNNHSHGIQKQTLETWLDGNYAGVDPESGLGLSNFPEVAKSMGLPVINISKTSEVIEKLKEAYSQSGPVFCNIEINPDQKLHPVLKAGDPLENQIPLMSNEDLERLLKI